MRTDYAGLAWHKQRYICRWMGTDFPAGWQRAGGDFQGARIRTDQRVCLWMNSLAGRLDEAFDLNMVVDHMKRIQGWLDVVRD